MITDREVERAIDDYLKKVRKVLPDSFETDDLVEDLREHIIDSFEDKRVQNSSETNLTIISAVLRELGEPDEIAREYSLETASGAESEGRGASRFYFLTRLFVGIAVVILAAWIASLVTEGALNFGYTVAILLVFVVAEWFVRAWQAGETSPLDVLRSK